MQLFGFLSLKRKGVPEGSDVNGGRADGCQKFTSSKLRCLTNSNHRLSVTPAQKRIPIPKHPTPAQYAIAKRGALCVDPGTIFASLYSSKKSQSEYSIESEIFSDPFFLFSPAVRAVNDTTSPDGEPIRADVK